MALLNKHQIALYDDLKSKIVSIWGGEIKIRVMTVREQLEFASLIESDPEDKAINFFLISKCCIDENGLPIFEDGDEEILNNKSLASINLLTREILSLSKQQPDDVESLAKN